MLDGKEREIVEAALAWNELYCSVNGDEWDGNPDVLTAQISLSAACEVYLVSHSSTPNDGTTGKGSEE